MANQMLKDMGLNLEGSQLRGHCGEVASMGLEGRL
jgi:hypothetical protein